MFNFAPVIPARSDLDWCWYLRRHGRAGDMFERALHDIGVMDPAGWAPWRRSLLTPTGAPVEVLFVAGQPDFALTTEVVDPAQDAADRLETVCRVIETLDGGLIDQSLLDVVGAAQGSGKLQYGARLGLTVNSSRFTCALFAELPENGADVARLLYRKTALAELVDGRPIMLKIDADEGMTTLSFPAQDIDLDGLNQAAGIHADAFSCPERWSQPSLISVAIDRDGALVSVVRTFRASDLFETDLKAGRYLRDAEGFDGTAYRAMVDHLPPTAGGVMAHNTISLTAARGAKARMQVSVAAPWGCMVDDM